MSDSDKPGQESTSPPEWMPGWYARAGEVLEEGEAPDVREAVRILGRDFPVAFLRHGETVGPARPPRKGITVSLAKGKAIDASLAVPFDYWVVRDGKGDLALYSDPDFKRGWGRIERDWIPAVERTLPDPGTVVEERLEAEGLGKPAGERMPAFMSALRRAVGSDVVQEPGEAGRRPTVVMRELAGAGWKGTPPAEGTRRRLILDTIQTTRSDGPALDLADAIESALLQSTIDAEAMERGGEALTDGITKVDPHLGIAKACADQQASHRKLRDTDPGFAEYHRGAEVAYGIVLMWLHRRARQSDAGTVDRLEAIAQERWERIGELEDQLEEIRERREAAAAGDVPAGTRELHIRLEDLSDPDGGPEYRFVEIEDQEGAGVKFPMLTSVKDEPGTSYRHIVIPYGRDDQWVQRLAMAAIVAGQDVDRPFPADALDKLLCEFGVTPTLPRDWPDRSELVDKVIAAIDAGPEPDDEAEYVDEAYDDRLLRQREEAREGESRFAEERDCAFALLRWLLPVVVPKRMD